MPVVQLLATRHLVTFIGACACALIGVIPAQAAGVPAGARIRIDRTFDVPAFERAVARRYHVRFHKIVAADIDRDGDLDVVGTTDLGFVFWVNDGQGHLTSQTPTRSPLLDSTAAATMWSGRDAGRDVSIQNDLPSPRLPGDSPRAPPSVVAQYHSTPDHAAGLDATFGCRVPRAPPV